jgi:UDP-2,3-diacylglucosamine pyrophosphatase LpxH
MGKHKRLAEVFDTSERIPFDDEDRIVFFSDLHRGNNSWADEFARNQIIYSYALQHYYDAGFTYVEVGDGDELLKFRDVETIRLAHEQIYHLLQQFHRERRFYFIFGNHDIEYRNPETLANNLNRLFSWLADEEDILFDDFSVHEGLIFSHRESGAEFFVVHGHQGEILNDRFFWLSRLLLRGLWRPLQLLGLQDPTSVSQNVNQRQNIERQLIDWVSKFNQPLICGHTHVERFPKKHEPPYFNTGSCVHPRWITCIEIKKGKIALVRWRIKPRKKGTLFVKRDIIGGPKNLARYAR